METCFIERGLIHMQIFLIGEPRTYGDMSYMRDPTCGDMFYRKRAHTYADISYRRASYM